MSTTFVSSENQAPVRSIESILAELKPKNLPRLESLVAEIQVLLNMKECLSDLQRVSAVIARDEALRFQSWLESMNKFSYDDGCEDELESLYQYEFSEDFQKVAKLKCSELESRFLFNLESLEARLFNDFPLPDHFELPQLPKILSEKSEDIRLKWQEFKNIHDKWADILAYQTQIQDLSPSLQGKLVLDLPPQLKSLANTAPLENLTEVLDIYQRTNGLYQETLAKIFSPNTRPACPDFGISAIVYNNPQWGACIDQIFRLQSLRENWELFLDYKNQIYALDQSYSEGDMHLPVPEVAIEFMNRYKMVELNPLIQKLKNTYQIHQLIATLISQLPGENQGLKVELERGLSTYRQKQNAEELLSSFQTTLSTHFRIGLGDKVIKAIKSFLNAVICVLSAGFCPRFFQMPVRTFDAQINTFIAGLQAQLMPNRSVTGDLNPNFL